MAVLYFKDILHKSPIQNKAHSNPSRGRKRISYVRIMRGVLQSWRMYAEKRSLDELLTFVCFKSRTDVNLYSCKNQQMHTGKDVQLYISTRFLFSYEIGSF